MRGAADARVYLLLGGLGASAIGFSAIFFTLAEVNAATGAFFRCALALPFLAALALREGRTAPALPPRARRLVMVAGIAFAADLVAWHQAIFEAGAGLATALGHTQVLFVTAIAVAFLGARLTRGVVVGIALVLAGVALVSGALETAPYGRDPALGALFGMAAGLLYALFVVLVRSSNATPGRSATTLLWATSAATGALALEGGLVGGVDFTPGLAALGWLLCLALASQVVGWMLISRGIAQLPAVTTSFVLTLQPVAAVLAAAAILSERPSALQLVGVAVLLAGFVVASISRAEPRPPAREPGAPAADPRAVRVSR